MFSDSFDEIGGNYLDFISERHTRYAAWCRVVDGLRHPGEEDRLRLLLDMRTGDLTDGTAGGMNFVREGGHYMTKADLRKMARKGQVAVLEPCPDGAVQGLVGRLRLGVFHDGGRSFDAVLYMELVTALWDLSDQKAVTLPRGVFVDDPITLVDRVLSGLERLRKFFRTR